MALKIENQATIPVKGNLVEQIQKMLEFVPIEHLRGLSKIVVLDQVESTFLDAKQKDEWPFLYIPKTPGNMAWGQVAVGALIPKRGIVKKITARMAFKATLAQFVFTIVGQHHAMTLGKNLKKGQLEPAVRGYSERYFKQWRESTHSRRTKLLKPIQPWLEKWAKKLNKQYQKSLKEKNSAAAK